MFRVYFLFSVLGVYGGLYWVPVSARGALWSAREGDTWSWVALHREENLPHQPTPRSTDEEIDFSKLHLFSNISGLSSTIQMTTRFQNQNHRRSYYQFIIRMGDTARITDMKIDHMGFKTSGRVMRRSRAERLIMEIKYNCSSSGVIMMRTSPYAREFDVFVFLSPGTRINVDISYKEQLQALVSAGLYEQIISVYPYQVVEDFQMDVNVNRPVSGNLKEVSAYWDSYSVSSVHLNPWGLREPMTIRPWSGGHRIGLAPTVAELQSPRSWQSDLIIFFELESGGETVDLDQPTWSSQGSSETEYVASDCLSSSDVESDDDETSVNMQSTLAPSTTNTPLTSYLTSSANADRSASSTTIAAIALTSQQSDGEAGSDEESGDGSDGTGSGYGGSGSEGSGEEEVETQTAGGDVTVTGRYSWGWRPTAVMILTPRREIEATTTEDDQSESNDLSTTGDFQFEENTESDEASGKVQKEENGPHFKIYQKETSLEFSLPSPEDSSEEDDSKFIKIFKRVMKKLFRPSKHGKRGKIVTMNGPRLIVEEH